MEGKGLIGQPIWLRKKRILVYLPLQWLDPKTGKSETRGPSILSLFFTPFALRRHRDRPRTTRSTCTRTSFVFTFSCSKLHLGVIRTTGSLNLEANSIFFHVKPNHDQIGCQSLSLGNDWSLQKMKTPEEKMKSPLDRPPFTFKSTTLWAGDAMGPGSEWPLCEDW